MGVNLLLAGEGGEHATDLCSNHGWTLAAEWLEGLDEGEYPAAVAFGRDGTFDDTEELADQIEAAFGAEPPDDPEVKDTVNRLLDLLGDGRPDETASVEV